jgi:hypothetical protein
MPILTDHEDEDRWERQPYSRAYYQGQAAYKIGKPITDNPYEPITDEYYQWWDGWEDENQ